MKISSMIFALQEVQTSLIADPLKRKLSATILKELKKEGSHAAILGKIAIQQYYEQRLECIIDSESCFDKLSPHAQVEVNDIQLYLAQLDESINILQTSQNICPNNEPAAESLLQLIAGNSSIEAAQVLTFKTCHKGVMLYPFLENGILLTKNDLGQLIKIINFYKPDGVN